MPALNDKILSHNVYMSARTNSDPWGDAQIGIIVGVVVLCIIAAVVMKVNVCRKNRNWK